MNLKDYLNKRQEQNLNSCNYRDTCLDCGRPKLKCYCPHIVRFDPMIKFVILIHPIEARRRIATGKMSHLILENSVLIRDEEFSENNFINQLLHNPEYHTVILYPSTKSVNITPLSSSERRELFPLDKKLVIFVIDGTWRTARKMLRHSPNLANLDQISFLPSRLSNFRVRKQPKPEYVSTIEAIHHTIELLGECFGFDIKVRKHDNLIHVFDSMIDSQLTHVKKQTRHKLKVRNK